MTTSISHAGITVVPYMVLGYESDRTINNIIHPILGRADPDVTLKPAGMRTGTLRFLCLTEATAGEIYSLHRDIGTFDLADDTWPGISMRYVTRDNLGLILESGRWIVSVGFQEVTV